MHGMSGLYTQYSRLIGYAANMYARGSPGVDKEDLFQDGCVKMLEYFGSHQDWADRRTHNTFKKNLFFWMHKLAVKQLTDRKIDGRRVIRLNFREDAEDDEHGLNVDDMIACADVSVLTTLFAREFVAELRRLLTGWDRIIFEMMVESAENGESRSDVVRRVMMTSGHKDSFVYSHMGKIRRVAIRALERSA